MNSNLSKKTNQDDDAVAEMCQEFWKLSATAKKAVGLLPDKEAKRLMGQLKFSKRQLDLLMQRVGLRFVDFEGEPFHVGLAVSVDNAGDFEDEEKLVVSRTIEPTVMSGTSKVRLGRVVVAPNQKEED